MLPSFQNQQYKHGKSWNGEWVIFQENIKPLFKDVFCAILAKLKEKLLQCTLKPQLETLNSEMLKSLTHYL